MAAPAAQLCGRRRCQSFATVHTDPREGRWPRRRASGRRRPGLTRRMARSTLRVGMLATAVLVGRKTAGGGKARDGQGAGGSGGPEAPGGLGAAAGGGPGASHETDPRDVANGGHGRQADAPQEIPPRGWKDIAKRTAKEVKQDQVPLLGAGVAFYALLSLFPAIIAGVSIYGLVADPDDRPEPDQPADRDAVARDRQDRRDPAQAGHQRGRRRPRAGHRHRDPDRPVERLQRHEGDGHRGQPGLRRDRGPQVRQAARAVHRAHPGRDGADGGRPGPDRRLPGGGRLLADGAALDGRDPALGAAGGAADRRPGRALPLRPRPRRAQVDLGELGVGDRHPAVDPGLDRVLRSTPTPSATTTRPTGRWPGSSS